MSHRASCHEMTTMDREESSGSGALIVAQRSRTDLAETASVESLRRDREAHRHRQIWTKDAHGGPYRKVGALPLLPFA